MTSGHGYRQTHHHTFGPTPPHLATATGAPSPPGTQRHMDSQPPTVAAAPTHCLGHVLSRSHTPSHRDTRVVTVISHTYMESLAQPITPRDRDSHGLCVIEEQACTLKTCIGPPRDNCPSGWSHSDTARRLPAQSPSHTHFRNGHSIITCHTPWP